MIVDDGLRRQLIQLDEKLSNPRVVLDSVNEGGVAYGPAPTPLLRYLGDSSLHIDAFSRSLFVLDASGHVVRTMAAPKQSDLGRLAMEASGIDRRGNLIYRAFAKMIVDTGTVTEGVTRLKQYHADSVAIVRGVYDTRTVDTLARLRIDNSTTSLHTRYPGGRTTLHLLVNPLLAIDEWAVLSDGTVALVRGHDYHVDFLMPDGTTRATEPLPFNWKQLSDDDKQRLVDSTRAFIERIRTDAATEGGITKGNNAVVRYMRAWMSPNMRPTPPPLPNAPKVVEPTMTYEFVPLKDIADYYPPIRYGNARGDADGNLWLLPTTSSESRHGELVYDVVRPGGIFYRVRMPVGRSVAGFGANGVVYLMHREGEDWWLERTSVVTPRGASN